MEDVRELFETAGFRVEALTCSVAPASGAPVGGPTTPAGVQFACVIAVRQ